MYGVNLLKMNFSKAIILDRDGTINIDKGYVHKIEDFELIPGVIEALKKFQKTYILIIFTNQSGIGRGFYTAEDLQILNDFMLKRFDEEGIIIKECVFCPHKPDDACECRKPKTKLINPLIEKYNIKVSDSYVIGDKTSDVKLAEKLGMKSILVKTGKGGKDKGYDVNPTFTAKDLLEASKIITNEI